jgi:hypothetical protein
VRFGRRDPKSGVYLVPILVISAHFEPKFVSRTLEIGGDAFIDKPSFDDFTHLTSKIQERLRLAGREDHAACASLGTVTGTPVAGAAAVRKVCSVVIPGTMEGSRTLVQIGGAPRPLSSGVFKPFLFLSAMSMRNPGAWGTSDALGMQRSKAGKSRLRAAFDGCVPAGFDPLEFDRKGRYRWHPSIVVERIDWEVLVRHADAPVRKLASEQLARAKNRSG